MVTGWPDVSDTPYMGAVVLYLVRHSLFGDWQSSRLTGDVPYSRAEKVAAISFEWIGRTVLLFSLREYFG